jgi:anti-anti-sigma factor
MTHPLADVTYVIPSPQHVIAITGEIDLSNADVVGASVVRDLRPGDSLILDTSDVTYIDSVGVAMLDGVSRQVSALCIVAPDESFVARLLALVNLGVATAPTRDAARDVLQRRTGAGPGA